MFSVSKFLQRAVLALALLIALATAAIAPDQGTGEHVAVLYAHDGHTLYRVEPNTGTFTKVGDLQHGFTGYGQMAYDWKLRKLYATFYFGEIGRVHNGIVELDTNTAVVREIPLDQPAGQVLVYSWPRGELLTLNGGGFPTAISTINTETGMVTVLTPPLINGPAAAAADIHGNLWSEETARPANFTRLDLIEWSLSDLTYIHELSSTTLTNDEAAWFFYGSLSFHPFAGLLFASAVAYDLDQDGNPVWSDNTVLCTVDLETSRPA
jgi:hypothetical protein